jgi:hypothetical protein
MVIRFLGPFEKLAEREVRIELEEAMSIVGLPNSPPEGQRKKAKGARSV